MNEQQQDIFYKTQDFSYNCILIKIKHYLSNKNNPINDELLSLFSNIDILFSDYDNNKDEHTKELEHSIYKLIDELGYYDDVKNLLKRGNE